MAPKQEFVRAGPLPGGVVSAVGYRAVRPGREGTRPLHRGLPSPYLTLIFSLDGPVVSGFTPDQATGSDAISTDVVVGGLHQSPAYVVQPDDETGIQLALHPLAARALLGVPAAELTGQLVTHGPDVLGRGAADLRCRLTEATDWDTRFAALADYLEKQLATHGDRPRPRPEVAEAWTWLARHRGAGTLRGLAAHVALSERRLSTLFRAETGATPKQAARLMRFEHAKAGIVRATAAGDGPDLARTAAACGYYDHSHLVRDFHQYTDLSPTAWLAEECRNIQAGGHRNGGG
ncbi:helix-turn-helix domain-containing protein [Streptomyces sp. NPDC057654]|uniref:AraC family transcriptional regulator n=1 Tax=Streptomyces sp. NPDC057654 TaxID=3346196 RepID=UPI0036C5E80F